MATQYIIKSGKTYATEANACKAADKEFPSDDLTYIVVKFENGRCAPVFIGEPATQAGVHFHFNVVG